MRKKKLIKHLLVASRTRVDIDLPKYLGMYKFTVVSPPLFASDGSFYKTTDKADSTAELRKLQSDDQPIKVVDTDTSRSLGKVHVFLFFFLRV